MTTEREINWAAPVIGKLEVGKTYVDRVGDKHRLTCEAGKLLLDVPAGAAWWPCGSFDNDGDTRHVADLIAEYTPPAPLKMWMNDYGDGSLYCHDKEEYARKIAAAQAKRIAVPVTITEGHEP